MDFVINAMTRNEIDEYDIFNYNHTHAFGCNQTEYNCMSYAFNAYEWLNPIDFYEEELDLLIKEAGIFSKRQKKKFSEAYYNCDFNNHYIRKIMISRLLKFFPKLRVVKSFEKLKENEYGISFATKPDDYHFVKFENGSYSHKRGGLPIEGIISDVEGFRSHGYNSKIIRFTMPKGDIEFRYFE